jgi:hypothetical protein
MLRGLPWQRSGGGRPYCRAYCDHAAPSLLPFIISRRFVRLRRRAQLARRAGGAALSISGATGLAVAPDYKGKGLQLQFTVEDEGVFTMPWSATITYWRSFDQWPEFVCAENRHEYYAGRDTAVPTADEPGY